MKTLRLAVPLVLAAFTLTCQGDQATPVAPEDVGIRAAPGGEPGKPPKDGGGVTADDLGYEIVVGPIVRFTSAAGQKLLSVTCPNGKVVISGGYWLEPGSDWTVLSELITDSGAGLANDQFEVFITKGAGGAVETQIWAACING